jgi:hypothetical protein
MNLDMFLLSHGDFANANVVGMLYVHIQMIGQKKKIPFKFTEI